MTVTVDEAIPKLHGFISASASAYAKKTDAGRGSPPCAAPSIRPRTGYVLPPKESEPTNTGESSDPDTAQHGGTRNRNRLARIAAIVTVPVPLTRRTPIPAWNPLPPAGRPPPAGATVPFGTRDMRRPTREAGRPRFRSKSAPQTKIPSVLIAEIKTPCPSERANGRAHEAPIDARSLEIILIPWDPCRPTDTWTNKQNDSQPQCSCTPIHKYPPWIEKTALLPWTLWFRCFCQLAVPVRSLAQSPLDTPCKGASGKTPSPTEHLS